MRTLNLGILAHVDAGKTSLTERLLFDAGVVDRLGGVDSGDTSTDTLAQERRRGITIRTAVASFAIGDLHVNLVDTPGHPDFIAEVERALGVVDGAVLVVSAVEGVQAQTRVILRVLRRLRIPTLVFVNKTDRTGADPDAVVARIADAVPMWADAREALGERDDVALAAFVEDRPVPDGTLERMVADATVLPAFRGSAITGEGVPELTDAIARLLPPAGGDPDGDLEAVVFAVDRSHAVHLRVMRGTVRVRDRVGDERVTAIDDGDRDELRAGEIGRVRGPRSLRIGDVLGRGTRTEAVFPPPTLVSTLWPVDPGERIALNRALQELAEQDPLIDVHLDQRRRELAVSLYGEVQKEVVRDTLDEDYGIAVEFGESTTLLRETPARRVTVGADLGEDGNPHLATLGLVVEPAERLEVVLGEMSVEHLPMFVYGTSAAFRDAIERYVRDALATGPQGWEVVDVRVTVTRCGYASPESRASDFRQLTAELLQRALAEGGTVLCEPVQRLMVEGPPDTLAGVLTAIPAHGGQIRGSGVRGDVFVAGADLPSARVADLERVLPSLTRGEGTVEATFLGWRPMGRG